MPKTLALLLFFPLVLLGQTSAPLPTTPSSSGTGIAVPHRLSPHAAISLEKLLALTRHPSPAIRRTALHIIAHRPSPELVAEMIRCAQDEDPDCVLAALNLLIDWQNETGKMAARMPDSFILDLASTWTRCDKTQQREGNASVVFGFFSSSPARKTSSASPDSAEGGSETRSSSRSSSRARSQPDPEERKPPPSGPTEAQRGKAVVALIYLMKAYQRPSLLPFLLNFVINAKREDLKLTGGYNSSASSSSGSEDGDSGSEGTGGGSGSGASKSKETLQTVALKTALEIDRDETITFLNNKIPQFLDNATASRLLSILEAYRTLGELCPRKKSMELKLANRLDLSQMQQTETLFRNLPGVLKVERLTFSSSRDGRVLRITWEESRYPTFDHLLQACSLVYTIVGQRYLSDNVTPTQYTITFRQPDQGRSPGNGSATAAPDENLDN